MSCYSQGSQIIIVPGGCLDHREIHLQCKSPQERVTYRFSLANRLAPNDFIVDVTAWPSDEQVGIDAFHVNGQT
ncbi:hypothetical protein, partial [Commensalibacter sp. Nvir]|uniref:hypothetical protein n=1 Tax=Commensalibacter sp. Nvir TaxID=3069817 RepID=UPI0030C803ED